MLLRSFLKAFWFEQPNQMLKIRAKPRFRPKISFIATWQDLNTYNCNFLLVVLVILPTRITWIGPVGGIPTIVTYFTQWSGLLASPFCNILGRGGIRSPTDEWIVILLSSRVKVVTYLFLSKCSMAQHRAVVVKIIKDFDSRFESHLARVKYSQKKNIYYLKCEQCDQTKIAKCL